MSGTVRLVILWCRLAPVKPEPARDLRGKMREMSELRRLRPGHWRAAATAGACILLVSHAAAQSTRRATTLDALDRHPVFFHGEEVVLVAEATSDQVLTWLVNEDDSVRVLALDVPPLPEGVREHLEVTGTFYDVGRLQENDQRLANLPIDRISDQLLRKPWPSAGELPLIVAASSRPAGPPPATTLRSIVLYPHRYQTQGVTVIGRFRGRNLYGDMPESPDESRWDFVLRSADAAVWVVGREPKGDGFELDVLARVDTGRWLEVTGAVRLEDNMVLIEAGALALAEPVPDRPAPPVAEAPRLPPPEVIFTAPLSGDVDVPLDTTVRVQFSRDMEAESFEGRVRVWYGPGAPPPDAAGAEITFEVTYLGRNRVLQIRFDQELVRFRNVTVELLEGVTANDGTPLPPWTLSFFVGG